MDDTAAVSSQSVRAVWMRFNDGGTILPPPVDAEKCYAHGVAFCNLPPVVA